MITADALYKAIDITWPPASWHTKGPWLLREGRGGGSRVSAATLNGDLDDITQAENAMRVLGQTPLFMVRDGEIDLDKALAEKDYAISKPVTLYAIPTAELATDRPPPVTCFTVWEPLQIMRDIWAAGGINAARIDVMDRVQTAKTGILGRLNDSPAAAAFVALHENIAMLHALEVLPHQRRQGMGQHMMRAAAFWAQEQGADYVSVLVTQDNTGANGLYRGLGMSPVAAYHYRELTETVR
ncbi:GNAT family N-acetyltransferase [Parasulfitobacter algicola]|uniref:GNAT family N-acetyltransferase n=1 Tax=Parasulfitobacter algicola TaxID=2614809 RepID=A0ABX2IWU4_9RHOB|nr:GNAT family N-acetyltransferase [Sulfitobacter algicola]NSX54593.1 GNAT family N-acetyltransferase [Sulfitobacter algicola]